MLAKMESNQYIPKQFEQHKEESDKSLHCFLMVKKYNEIKDLGWNYYIIQIIKNKEK